MARAPGSFTRNFAWHGKGFEKAKGLEKLHIAIRAGFQEKFAPVERADWRRNSGLTDDASLIAVNFFLFNVIEGGKNIIPVDELVFQALGKEHSPAFDRLTLFVLNLSLGGRRLGTESGVEYPTLWANEFVRERLWQSGRWQANALDDEAMNAFLEDRIIGSSFTKSASNYRALYKETGFLPSLLPQINTDAESWAGPALFLAWDRRHMAGIGSLTSDDLVGQSQAEEDFKLLGLAADEFKIVAEPIADQYVDARGIARFATIAKLISGGSPKPGKSRRRSKPAKVTIPPSFAWIEEANNQRVVERQLRQRLAQKRNQKAAAMLKMLYDHTCMACGIKIEVGFGPMRYYSEAAHIRPLGDPHKGPDTLLNMIVLCPNHHLQFDRGVLSMRMNGTTPTFISRIAGDPIDGKAVPLRAPHRLDPAQVQWHENNFGMLPKD